MTSSTGGRGRRAASVGLPPETKHPPSRAVKPPPPALPASVRLARTRGHARSGTHPVAMATMTGPGRGRSRVRFVSGRRDQSRQTKTKAGKRVGEDGSDGTRTRDLRRDGPRASGDARRQRRRSRAFPGETIDRRSLSVRSLRVFMSFGAIGPSRYLARAAGETIPGRHPWSRRRLAPSRQAGGHSFEPGSKQSQSRVDSVGAVVDPGDHPLATFLTSPS